MRLYRDFSLKELTSWGCGGRCLWLASPESPEEAADLIKREGGTSPLYVLGGGTNLLVQEGRLEVGVISSSALRSLKAERTEEGLSVELGSGCTTKELLAFAIKNSVGGLEFLAGIPGSGGGAVAGNAGASGIGFGPLVEAAETVEKDGTLRLWKSSELKWNYRKAPWEQPPLLITRIFLKLRFTNKDNIIKNIRHFAELKKGQPIGAKTAGCVFKNPEGNAAGRLLDLCGCKELTRGAAAVSSHHANFIENRGEASSEDIYLLAEQCRQRVLRECGIKLEYEIKFLGSFMA